MVLGWPVTHAGMICMVIAIGMASGVRFCLLVVITAVIALIILFLPHPIR